jgi:hypothetical protein
MDCASLRQQVVKWARERNTSPERAEDYGNRALQAYDAIVELAPPFVNKFNASGVLRLRLDKSAIVDTVLGYTRDLLELKTNHSFATNDRADTHIAAGLWFSSLMTRPVFGIADGTQEAALASEGEEYWHVVCRFAFYYSFRILRGHYKNFQELPLLQTLSPVQEYLTAHYDQIASPVFAVGIFLTISVFDPLPGPGGGASSR